MDPQSFIARAEAQRWLGIAEKLLIGHDLVGSKTFAIRARESDPRLEAAEQILAIADTLLAAEKRVVGTNGAHQPDYYAILQLVRFVQDTDHIASQYRRLAVALNPHQNRFPYADQAFQLVNDAWAVLSNPMRKSMYDSDLDYPQQQMNNLGFNLEQQHHQQQQHQQQQPHNFFSINQELPEQQQQQQTFQSRLHQSQQHQQLQQHNFLSQPNPVRPLPVREQEHVFQHREQEQLFQQQVQPFQVTSPPHQQARMSPQPQQHIQSPPATPQSPFSWPQSSQMSQPHQQIQHQHQHQVKQEQQHLQQVKQEHHMKHEQQLQQQMKQEQQKQQQLQQEQLKQQQLKKQQLQQEQLKQHQLKQQQLQEEQRKQQQLQQEQLKQQQLMEEQRKQQQLQEEQRKQQQLLEEQRQQQQLLEEQRKQQQLLEEQRKQQQLLEEQRKQQQLLEEQRKQQQLQEEQRKQQQLLEEQQKQQQLQEEQRKQEQLLEEQRKQEQLLEEQRKQQQLQEEQRKQQQLQEEQRKQELLQQEQQQDSARQSAAPVPHPYNGVRDEGTEPEAETEVVDDSPTFWTACPYCFYMYEYPKVYVECTLRCDNCKRAFQAVRISSPPPIIEGQDAYFYCWGFIPVGLSMSPLQKSNNRGRNSNWTPFSSLHNTSNNVQNHLNEQAAPKENLFVNKSSGPRIYIDDITDDMFIGISDPSSDSDTDWGGTKKQKSKRMDKGFKERIQVLALRAVYAKNSSVKNLKHGIPVQKGVEVPTVLVVETSKINVGSNPRKKPGRVAQERGKLDLNVEFNNNDGEETAPRMTAVTHVHEQGDEDNIEEGIEFFEGLDEYLSSLPILSVVNEEKVKAA
ncbi:hypothetical protein R6Q59_018611 [Mikania micrantha]